MTSLMSMKVYKYTPLVNLSNSSDEEIITCPTYINDILCIRKFRLGIYNAIKYNMGKIRMEEIIGCSIDELILLIQSKFSEEMSWSNYGVTWYICNGIGHKYYNLGNISDYKRCFNWKNLTPIKIPSDS